MTGHVEGTPFSYRTSKDGKVFIAWEGRQVVVLKGERAKTFLQRVTGATEARQQLIMAKATGNFKRGNEKDR